MTEPGQPRSEQMQKIAAGLQELNGSSKNNAQKEALAQTLEGFIPELRQASVNIKRSLSLDSQGISDAEIAALIAARERNLDNLAEKMQEMVTMLEARKKENSPYL